MKAAAALRAKLTDAWYIISMGSYRETNCCSIYHHKWFHVTFSPYFFLTKCFGIFIGYHVSKMHPFVQLVKLGNFPITFHCFLLKKERFSNPHLEAIEVKGVITWTPWEPSALQYAYLFAVKASIHLAGFLTYTIKKESFYVYSIEAPGLIQRPLCALLNPKTPPFP